MLLFVVSRKLGSKCFQRRPESKQKAKKKKKKESEPFQSSARDRGRLPSNEKVLGAKIQIIFKVWRRNKTWSGSVKHYYKYYKLWRLKYHFWFRVLVFCNTGKNCRTHRREMSLWRNNWRVLWCWGKFYTICIHVRKG